MGKTKTSIIDESKAEVKQNKKETKTMNRKPLIETLKTILLTVLITAILAFIGGMQYQTSNNDKVHAEAKALVSSITPLKQ